MKEDILINLLREVKQVLDKHGVEFWPDTGTLLGAVRDGKLIPWEHDIDFGAWDMDISDNVKRLIAGELSDRDFKVNIFDIPTPHMHIHHKEEDVWVDINLYRLIDDKAILPRWEPIKLIGVFLSHFLVVLSRPYYYEVDFRAKPYIKSFMLSILIKLGRGLPASLRVRLTRIVAVVYEKIGAKDVSWVVPAEYFKDLATMTFYGMELKVPAKKEEYLAFRYGEDWRIPRRDWITIRDDGAVVNSKWRG